MYSVSKPVTLLGTGEYQPKQVITSLAIDQALKLKPGHTEQLTGVESRRFADTESASSMAVQAIKHALEASHLHIDDIDLIIAACGTMEQSIPYNAAKVHALLGPNQPPNSSL